MTQLDKLINKLLKSPSSLKYSQIEKILLHIGYIKIPAKGSHIKFKHKQTKSDLIIPLHNKDCQDFYKKLAVKHITKNNLLQ